MSVMFVMAVQTGLTSLVLTSTAMMTLLGPERAKPAMPTVG